MALILFLPGALLAAAFLTWVGAKLGRGLSPAWRKGLAGWVVMGLVVWGIALPSGQVRPVVVLAEADDLPALAWVRDNTPADARFLINAVLWQKASYRGVDGGYWLSVLAQRWTVVPPAVYGWGSREEIRQVNLWASQAAELRACDAPFWGLVRAAGLTYVYVVEGRGQLQPQALAGCVGVRPVYASGKVHIYKLVGSGGD